MQIEDKRCSFSILSSWSTEMLLRRAVHGILNIRWQHHISKEPFLSLPFDFVFLIIKEPRYWNWSMVSYSCRRLVRWMAQNDQSPWTWSYIWNVLYIPVKLNNVAFWEYCNDSLCTIGSFFNRWWTLGNFYRKCKVLEIQNKKYGCHTNFCLLSRKHFFF